MVKLKGFFIYGRGITLLFIILHFITGGATYAIRDDKMIGHIFLLKRFSNFDQKHDLHQFYVELLYLFKLDSFNSFQEKRN